MKHRIRPEWFSVEDDMRVFITAKGGNKLQAVKLLKDISTAKLGKENAWGLKECKDWVDEYLYSASTAETILQELETIKHYYEMLPVRISEALNLPMERAVELLEDWKKGGSDLARKLQTTGNAERFGI